MELLQEGGGTDETPLIPSDFFLVYDRQMDVFPILLISSGSEVPDAATVAIPVYSPKVRRMTVKVGVNHHRDDATTFVFWVVSSRFVQGLLLIVYAVSVNDRIIAETLTRLAECDKLCRDL